MNRNLGKLDQFIRIVAGFAIFAFLFKENDQPFQGLEPAMEFDRNPPPTP